MIAPAYGWGFFLPVAVFFAAQQPRCHLSGGVTPVRAGHNDFMLWIKAFHIIFVASWFAGLFYLPRIFVNIAMVTPGSVAERERLLLMARKLLRFTTLLARYACRRAPIRLLPANIW